MDTHWGYPQVMEATIPHSGADWHGTSYNDGKFNVIIERCVDENGKEIAKAVVSQMNQYFIDHPEMVLGEMREVNGPYGPETACLPMEGRDLGDQLNAAIQNIQGSITEYVLDDPEVEDKSIPADPEVRNFSYTLVDGQVYYRENSRMTPAERSRTAQERIKGLIGLRNCVRTLIEYQTEDYPNADIQAEQSRLNSLYDAFVKEHGHIAQWNIKVHFSKHTGEWNVEGKAVDRGNVKASNTYGTKRINGS